MALHKLNNNNNNKNNNTSVRKHRFLIVVNVLGSPGSIKYVVNGDDSVSTVIDMALKLYAREGRLPFLGSGVNNCLLYPSNAGDDALNPHETISACGGRNFLLCKSNGQPEMRSGKNIMARKKSTTSCWKALLTRSSTSANRGVKESNRVEY